MKVTIEITCETITEFLAHLSHLRMQTHKECKRLGIPLDQDFPPGMETFLEDDNCYGTRTVSLNYTEV